MGNRPRGKRTGLEKTVVEKTGGKRPLDKRPAGEDHRGKDLAPFFFNLEALKIKKAKKSLRNSEMEFFY